MKNFIDTIRNGLYELKCASLGALLLTLIVSFFFGVPMLILWLFIEVTAWWSILIGIVLIIIFVYVLGALDK